MTFGRWRQQLHLLVALSKLSDGTPVQQVSNALGYESTNEAMLYLVKRDPSADLEG